MATRRYLSVATLLLAMAACGSTGSGDPVAGTGGNPVTDPVPTPVVPEPIYIPGDFETATPTGGSTTPGIGLPGGTPKPVKKPVYPSEPVVVAPTTPTSPTTPTTPTTPTGPVVPTTPVSGAATYTGQYRATYFANISDPLAFTTTDTGGALSLEIDLDGGAVSGTSEDGHLTISRRAGTGANSPFQGTATYKGLVGAFGGSATETRAEAQMAGETVRDAFVGSFDVAK